MHHSFFIRSFVDGHLGCFYVLATVNSAAVNIGVKVTQLYLDSPGILQARTLEGVAFPFSRESSKSRDWT